MQFSAGYLALHSYSSDVRAAERAMSIRRSIQERTSSDGAARSPLRGGRTRRAQARAGSPCGDPKRQGGCRWPVAR